MKKKPLVLFASLLAITLFSCTKEADSSNCEDENTTKVTYTNQGTVPLRVKVAAYLNSSFEPISPILDFELAPGASQVKVFRADKYFTLWYNNCATSCTLMTYYNKQFDACMEYEEKK